VCTNPAAQGYGVIASDVVTPSANTLTGRCSPRALVTVTIAPTPALIAHIKGNPATLAFALALEGNGLSRPVTEFTQPAISAVPGPSVAELGRIAKPTKIPSIHAVAYGWVIQGILRYWKSTGAGITTQFFAPLVRTTGFGRCVAALPSLTGSGPAGRAGALLLPVVGSSSSLITSGASEVAANGATVDLAGAAPPPSDSFGDWRCASGQLPAGETSGAGYLVQAPDPRTSLVTCSALVPLNVETAGTLTTFVTFLIGAMSALAIQWLVQLAWHYAHRRDPAPGATAAPRPSGGNADANGEERT
jgi:hypothetical protein